MQNDKFRSDWTPEEHALLREHFPIKDSAEVARLLGRTLESVRSQAYLLGLKKTPKTLSAIARKTAKEFPRIGNGISTPNHTTTDELKCLHAMRENPKALKGYIKAAEQRANWGGIDKQTAVGRARAYLANPESFIASAA